ncbi:MAG TPA: trp RNA-binding attenuation protein MtrB [Clostridia bacterium]|mgnify:CR=1 FL=1|jgi:transcription attenuation protein (tryptophan RNA-binding attenuator protein)|nr:trp RNA-binding attenuation protein MtrB [Clostridia bacterium]HPQ46004.1 trp RNA-binding attenuation protein MtrB [Clostridia bacterium]HRX42587.1 trp RNA-binding attenuation protein MtrB [Clostridia bacterium]
MENNYSNASPIIVKALEDGVSIIGLTRGESTKFHHIEKMDKGEVLIVEFTEFTAAIKIKGKAQIICSSGETFSG